MMSRVRSIRWDEYVSIQDAIHIAHSKGMAGPLHLLSVVAEIGIAVQSQGSDYVLALKIMDQSYQQFGFTVNIFAADTATLPDVKDTLDVIIFHNVTVKTHQGSPYGIYNKSKSSFALFRGRPFTDDFRPYQVSQNYQRMRRENDFLAQIRSWLLGSSPHEGLRKLETPIKSINAGSYFDIVAKAFHTIEDSNGGYVLYIWDGFDAPTIEVETSLDAEGQFPCPLHVEEESLSIEVLTSFKKVGTVLRVFAESSSREIQYLRHCSCWIRLCNVTFERYCGIWKGNVGYNSRIRLLSDRNESVKDRVRMFRERTTLVEDCQPSATKPEFSSITEVDRAIDHYSTLMDSIVNSQPHVIKTIVRVVAAYPWKVDDLDSVKQMAFVFRFTLEDPTARVHAYLFYEDLGNFFGEPLTCKDVNIGVRKLLGTSEETPSRNPPWIWCILKYSDSDRSHRIVGTKLKRLMA